jgi:hypothetical protein
MTASDRPRRIGLFRGGSAAALLNGPNVPDVEKGMALAPHRRSRFACRCEAAG